MTTEPLTVDPPDQEDIQNDEVIGRAFRRSLILVAVVLLAGLGIWGGSRLLDKPEDEQPPTEIALPQPRKAETFELPHIPLTDITQVSGIDWTHVSGMEGEKLLPETMGGGVAVFDYDRDGDQDLLFVGGTTWPWAEAPNANPRSLCLYQNDGRAQFQDVTRSVGLELNFYGMGPAIGDFDNDGWPDLFLTAVGKNHLFRNREGTFVDVTESAGVAGLDTAWSTGSTWLDYDRDGRLDLFVCDYVLWARDLDLSLNFSLTGIGRAYGQPTSFTGTHSHLFHNEGDGRFTDVSKQMGIEVANLNTQVPVGKGLGVAAVDVDHDGWTDLIVANDTVQNFLFMNQEGKAFEESGVPIGIALDRSGNATGAMGLDCCYLRNDESLAIAIGNFANEQSSLYVSRGPDPQFSDLAMSSGLGPVSRLSLTFGMFFADLDLDSRQDIVCSNGHLEAEISKVQATQQYAQPPQYFWNAGSKGSSELVALTADQVGSEAVERMVARGAAYGDIDGDGDIDIILVANSGPPKLLRNDQQLGHHWIRLKLEGSGASNRDALGALVIVRSGDVTQRRIVTTTRSYLSQCEPTLTFGLGTRTDVEEIIIHWPDGQRQTLPGLEIDQTHLIKQPGEAVSSNDPVKPLHQTLQRTYWAGGSNVSPIAM